MPTPTIDPETSVPALREGEAYEHQFSATPAPDDWEARGLPSGLTINAAGLVTGTPDANSPGFWNARLTAIDHEDRLVTADPGTDLLTSAGNSFAVDEAIEFVGADLPSPLAPDTKYFVRDKAGDDYKVSEDLGGPAIDITAAGTGKSYARKFYRSAELLVAFGVEIANGLLTSDNLEMQVNVDIETGDITLPGIPSGYNYGPPSANATGENQPDAAPPFWWVKRGDRFPVSIAFQRKGRNQDLNVDTLKFVVSEFEPERKFQINESTTPTKVGTGRSTRYRVMVNIDPAKFTALMSNYEDDEGTYFDANAEIQLTIPATPPESSTYDRTIAVNLNATGGMARSDTFDFNDLPKDSNASYTATIKLKMPGRTTQEVTLVRELDVTWNGSSFGIAEIQGPISGQGTDETPDHWRSTFSNNASSATAAGINLGTLLETTDQDEWLLELGLCNLWIEGGSLNGDMYMLGQDAVEIWDTMFTSDPNHGLTILLEAGDMEADILAKWNATPAWTAADEVRFEDGKVYVVWYDAYPGDVQGNAQNHTCAAYTSIFHRPTGLSYGATAEIRLLGETDTPDEEPQERKSSRTLKLRMERDQAPD